MLPQNSVVRKISDFQLSLEFYLEAYSFWFYIFFHPLSFFLVVFVQATERFLSLRNLNFFFCCNVKIFSFIKVEFCKFAFRLYVFLPIFVENHHLINSRWLEGNVCLPVGSLWFDITFWITIFLVMCCNFKNALNFIFKFSIRKFFLWRFRCFGWGPWQIFCIFGVKLFVGILRRRLLYSKAKSWASVLRNPLVPQGRFILIFVIFKAL